MKHKKNILAAAAVLAAVLAVIGLKIGPAIRHGMGVSRLLEPWLEGKDQTMHLSVSARINGEHLTLEGDVYLVTEAGTPFLILEQQGTRLYVSENVLFLENGKAFALGRNLGLPAVSWQSLLPRIGGLYEALTVTAGKNGGGAVYEIQVTGDRIAGLLEPLSIGGALPLDGIGTLGLSLTEQDGRLGQIRFSGTGAVEGVSLSLDAVLSGFRHLSPGERPLPDAVRHSAATVNPGALFSLTEDLYRLVPALMQQDMSRGTLVLKADCGLLQLDTRLDMSRMKELSGSGLDPQQLQALPELLGLLCMEGNILCRQTGGVWVYTLELEQEAMAKLARMILPELSGYADHLTQGTVTLTLAAGRLRSLEVAVRGNVTILMARIPLLLQAEFLW